MASEKQQAGRALRRLARKNPLVALAIAAVLVVGAALGWFGAAAGGGAEDAAPDRNGQAAVISAEDNRQQAQVVRVVDGDTLKVSVPGDENATVRLIGSKWKILIMRNLMMRTWRFNELKKDLDGISQKVLTESLRSMDEDGLITRTVYPEVPPRVEYSLTELGESMRPILNTMADWGSNYKRSFDTK